VCWLVVLWCGCFLFFLCLFVLNLLVTKKKKKNNNNNHHNAFCCFFGLRASYNTVKTRTMLQRAFRARVKPLMRSAKTFATASKLHVPTRRTLFTHQVNRRVLGSGSSPFSLDSTMFRTLTTDASGLTNNGSQEKQNGIFDPKTQVARDALENAKTALSEAEKKRDAAEEKWINDGKQDGFYFNALNDAQATVNRAQAAVERAHETYDLHVRGLANGNGQGIWERVEHMDSYPAELLKAYHATKELEKLEEESGGELAPGTWSSCGNVEHLGAGVFLEPNTPPIDPDSATRSGTATITRRETRFIARAAVDAVFDDESMGKVVVVGQPGTGKTRGSTTVTIQELLVQGRDVLRVGYKDERVLLFEKNATTGVYEAWEFTGDISTWASTNKGRDREVVAVIDPPEKTSNYTDIARCRVIKFVSNSAEHHFGNAYKDGVLLVTAMPTAAETAAVTRVLWNHKRTPMPGHSLDRLEDMVAEILQRAVLVGHSWRQLFSYEDFAEQVQRITNEATVTATNFTDAQLLEFYPGDLANRVEADSADASSRLFFLNPRNTNTSDAHWTSRRSSKGVTLSLNPLASSKLRDRLTALLKEWTGKKAFPFESLCFGILRRGVQLEGQKMRELLPVRANSHEESYHLLNTVGCADGKIVRASNNFPVADFFMCASELFNAKVGPNQITLGTSALKTFVLNSGLGSSAGGTLRMNDSAFKATLTFLRNSDNTSFSLKKTNDVSVAAVQKIFDDHFTVKFVNVCDIPEAEGMVVDGVLQHYKFDSKDGDDDGTNSE